MKNNLTFDRVRAVLGTALDAITETANRWSFGIFVLIKTVGALFGLVALVGMIVTTTLWYIERYGSATFIVTLILSTFVLSAISTINVKKN